MGNARADMITRTKTPPQPVMRLIVLQLRDDRWVQSPQTGEIIMLKKISVLALAVFAFGFAAAPRSIAGTEMVEPDNAPRYNYRPAPAPRVYYAPPPPVPVVVYPAVRYYAAPVVGIGYHRVHGRRPYCPPRRWR